MFLGFRILLFSQHTQNLPIASLFKFHVLFFFVSNLNSLSPFLRYPKPPRFSILPTKEWVWNQVSELLQHYAISISHPQKAEKHQLTLIELI
jgi:hypothetical protein